MTPESIRLIAEIIGLVVVAFVSHYLTKSHYDRKRQDDLADRDFTRRTKILDKAIEEIQTHLSAFLEAVRILTDYEIDVISNNLDSNINLDKIREIVDPTRKGVLALTVIDDLELNRIYGKLGMRFEEEFMIALDLPNRIEKHEGFDKKAELKQIREFQTEMTGLTTLIQQRLTKLAQTAK